MISTFGHTETVTKKNLVTLRLKVPTEAKAYWNGIEHAEADNHITSILTAQGFPIVASRYAVAPSGINLMASYDVSHQMDALRGGKLSVSVLVGNDRKRATTFFFGVRYDDWSMCLAKYTSSHKNTIGLDVRNMFEDGLLYLINGNAKKEFKERVEEYATRYVSVAEGDYYLANACRVTDRRFRFLWSKLGLVDQMRINKNGRETLHSLLRAYGLAVNTMTPYTQPDVLYTFSELLPG